MQILNLPITNFSASTVASVLPQSVGSGLDSEGDSPAPGPLKLMKFSSLTESVSSGSAEPAQVQKQVLRLVQSRDQCTVHYTMTGLTMFSSILHLSTVQLSLRPDEASPEQLTPTREYERWMNENLMMAELDTSSSKCRLGSVKEERVGGAFQIYPRKQIVGHLERFKDGVSYLTTEAVLNRFGRASMGCPDGSLFVSPAAATADVLKRSGGEVAKIKELLGVPHWPEDSVIKVISINNPKNFLINLPTGSEWTANDEFELGGYTKNGVPEAVLQKKVPEGEYTEYTPEEFLAARRLACRGQ